MKRNILYRICGTLFSLSALAACGLEPQEECLPCNGKLRYTEVHMEGAPSAAGFATPLYVFRRAAGTQDGKPRRCGTYPKDAAIYFNKIYPIRIHSNRAAGGGRRA